MPKMKLQKKQESTPCEQPFPYADYVNARQALVSALEGGCFYGPLTGRSGMGKTALLG